MLDSEFYVLQRDEDEEQVTLSFEDMVEILQESKVLKTDGTQKIGG